MTFHGVHFVQPWWLLLLPLVLLLGWLMSGRGQPPSVRYSSASLLRSVGKQARFGPRRLGWLVRLLALTLLIIALARPRLEYSDENQERLGIDVVIVSDMSGSMGTRDYQLKGQTVTRMDALVDAISNFVAARPKERTGLIGFAADVYLLSPLTTDASYLPEILRQSRMLAGTAIGEGMFAGIQLLEKSDAKSKVMIVVSDGFNNRGRNPLDAAKAAARKGIRVHTLQVMSFREMANARAGSGLMNRIAQDTGGVFFSASNSEALQHIYQQIDSLEKQRFEVKEHKLYSEAFFWPALIAFALVGFELLAGSTFWLRLP